MPTKHAVHFSSATDKWRTPTFLVEKIAAFMGQIDLDPCADPAAPHHVPAWSVYVAGGLEKPWFGRTYVNPPYGREIVQWVAKLVMEYLNGNVTEAITLLPARTDTRWWRKLEIFPVVFVRGRLQFNDCGQSAPFPSALVYLGREEQRFAETFYTLGALYFPWRPKP